MKKYLFIATALVALASCSSDEFVGENTTPTNSNTYGAIQFTPDAGKITRATSNTGTVAQMLDGQFKVYGVKNVKDASDNDVYSTVFPNYVAWNKSSLTSSTSNPDGNNASNGWEYVGPNTTTYGSDNPLKTIGNDQTIKYWDYAAANYHFVAGSPVNSFTYKFTSNDVTGATVKNLAGHINPNTSGTPITTSPVYIAEPVNVEPADYQKPVTFTFRRQQSRVRVGIYETIPGYKITEIKFYPYDTNDWGNTSSDNIILASTTSNYFVGGANDAVIGTITYDWTTPSYTFTYAAADDKTLTQAKNWYGGAYNYAASGSDAEWGPMAITSSEINYNTFYGKDKDMDATGYFTVLPTPSATTAAPLLIKCDYKLESEKDGSGEVINVKGATAVVPAAFSKWAPNTSYTYLFKISDNTNGYTGTTSQPGGIYPITFDALVTAEASQGTITTVSTPSITTYQEGSVSSTGISYTASNKPIYITVNTDGTLATLTSENTKLYVVSAGTTEADLMLTAPSTVASGDNVLSIVSATNGETVNSVTFQKDKAAKFIPAAGQTYAVEFYDGTTKHYKVIEVASASGGGSRNGGE